MSDGQDPNTSTDESKLIAPVELRELQRVYDYFCNLSDKLKIIEKLDPAKMR